MKRVLFGDDRERAHNKGKKTSVGVSYDIVVRVGVLQTDISNTSFH